MRADSLFDVTGKIAVVTGAARGLGLAMAEVLAANGAIVTLADIDAARIEAEVARLRAEGFAVAGTVLDVADRDRVHAAIDEVQARHGRLDIVFANAGISAGPGFNETVGRIENVVRDDWDRVLSINLTGVFTTVQAAARHMKNQGSGRIVVTSSIAGLRAEPPCGYAYVTTKAAVINLVRQAALELAPFNVLVNGIAPGPFLTNIAGGRLRREPERHAEFAASTALKRLAQPDEIKGLALLLASPAGSFITGVVIPIDGGSTA
jgi:NAD(P)-dependent dehydrogenase (short-subunit alcohol dehydrogenase family)